MAIQRQRIRQASYPGVIPIIGVQAVQSPPAARKRAPVDLKPYEALLRRAEKVRNGKGLEDAVVFIIPEGAQHTLRTRLNQSGEKLNLGVSLTADDDQGDVFEGQVRMRLATGPRRARTRAESTNSSIKE